MARPRNFDEDQALDRAMLVFWQRGFAGTSVSDLVEATGLGRQSLYNTFGDKSELFGRALKRYVQENAEHIRPLMHPEANLSTIRKYVLANMALQQEASCGACMVVKTAFDHQVPDPEIAGVVQQAAQATRQLFARVIQLEKERGAVAKELDAEAAGSYLFSSINGLSALLRTGASRQEIEWTLDFTLAALRNGAPVPAMTVPRAAAQPSP